MKWKWIKRIRSEYKQRPVSLKDCWRKPTSRKPTSRSKQGQTFAEHLSHQQWAAPQHQYMGSHEPILHTADVDQPPITFSELNYALVKSAKNRAAVVDDILTEAWQWLDNDNRMYLLNLLNDAWSSQSVPQEWQTPLVVEVYKGKGAPDDPNNYRPIRLQGSSSKGWQQLWTGTSRARSTTFAWADPPHSQST